MAHTIRAKRNSVSADTLLVGLCAKLIVVEARGRMLPGADYGTLRQHGERVARLATRIGAITPVSVDGMVAKARAAYGLARAGEAGSGSIEQQLAYSVLRDLACGPRFLGPSFASSSALARRSSGTRAKATPAKTSR